MKREGFMLIELLMASLALSVLAAVAIPNFTGLEIRAKEAKVRSVAHALQMAVEDYKSSPGNEGTKPTSISQFLTFIPVTIGRRNPFDPERHMIVSGSPRNPGEVGYIFNGQTTPYMIVASGQNNVYILTLVEGQ